MHVTVVPTIIDQGLGVVVSLSRIKFFASSCSENEVIKKNDKKIYNQLEFWGYLPGNKRSTSCAASRQYKQFL